MSPRASCLPLPGLSPAASHNFASAENNPLSCFVRCDSFCKGSRFRPMARAVATVGGISGLDKDVRIWDATTGRALGECEKDGANNGMEKAAVQCFGNPPVLAASSYYLSAFPRSDNKIIIQIWDLATQQPKQRFQWEDRLVIRQSVFSRDGRWFVYSNGHLRAFDLQSERVVVDLKRQKDGSIRCVAISAAQDRLACATDEKELEIWDVASGQLTQQIHTTERVSCMDFSPDGRFLAYGSDSGTIEQIEIGGKKAAALPAFVFRSQWRECHQVFAERRAD